MTRLTQRIQRLEAQWHQAEADPPYTPPEPPPGWYEEVFRLLWSYGYLESVLRETFKLSEEEVAQRLEEAASYFAATD